MKKYQFLIKLLAIVIACNFLNFNQFYAEENNIHYNQKINELIHKIKNIEKIIQLQSQVIQELQIQIDDNQKNINFLRGQIQENDFFIKNIIEKKEKYYEIIN